MSRLKYRSISLLVLVATGLVWLTVRVSGQTGAATHSTAKGEWPTYAGDVKGTRYAPLAQINADNFSKLQIAWRFKTNHAALKGLNIPRTGQAGTAGTLVTKTLVIAGDLQATTVADRPRGAMLRAYDKATGKEVGAVYMPAPQSGSPMTYMHQGKQYLVVGISGGGYTGEYIALSLP